MQLRAPSAWAFGSVNRWPRPRRCSRGPSSFPPMPSRTVTPCVNWRSTCQRFSPLVGLEEGVSSRIAALRRHRLHASLGRREAVSPGRSRLLAQAEAIRSSSRWPGTVGAAWALAHTATVSLVPAGDEEAALSGLPVAALRLPSAVLERSGSLGLRTIGDVLRLPRETLASRFGVILPQRLDQALGLTARDLRLRAARGAALQSSASGRCRSKTACPGSGVPADAARSSLSMAEPPRHGSPGTGRRAANRDRPVTIDIRLVEPTRDERASRAARRAATGATHVVRGRRRRSLDRAQTRAVGASRSATGSTTMPRRTASRAFNSLVDRLSSRLERECGAAGGSPSRRTARARGPARPVDEP